ncbi:MAG TPA: hypothetical protein VN153_10850 [Tahibacter sp.]|nr:hypothetical protein [Tahibacter sp.]
MLQQLVGRRIHQPAREPQRLERNGLIERIADPHDRRSSAAALTGEGRKLIDKAIAVRFGEAADALSGLSAAERARLAALLKKLGRTLGQPGEANGDP